MQSCLECYYSLFDSCPAGGSFHNAACLTLGKEIRDMDPRFLRKRTEELFKEGLVRNAKKRDMRLMYIDNMFGKQEEIDE